MNWTQKRQASQLRAGRFARANQQEPRCGTGSKRYTMSLSEAGYERALRGGPVQQLQLRMKQAGARQVRGAARDRESGHIGSASEFGEVLDLAPRQSGSLGHRAERRGPGAGFHRERQLAAVPRRPKGLLCVPGDECLACRGRLDEYGGAGHALSRWNGTGDERPHGHRPERPRRPETDWGGHKPMPSTGMRRKSAPRPARRSISKSSSEASRGGRIQLARGIRRARAGAGVRQARRRPARRRSRAQAARARLHRLMLSAAYTWSLNAIAALWRGVQIYGMRLYAGEPALILRAQGQLLLWTARCLTGSLRPTAVSMLAPGESATVTGQFSSADRGLLAATLEGRGSRAEACAPGHRGIAGARGCHRESCRMRGRAAIFLGNPLVRAAVDKRVVPDRPVGCLGLRHRLVCMAFARRLARDAGVPPAVRRGSVKGMGLRGTAQHL
jgi:hypothetical protein